MAKRPRQPIESSIPFAAVIDTANGNVALVEPGTAMFDQVAGLLMLPRMGTPQTRVQEVYGGASGKEIATASALNPFLATGRRTADLQWYLGIGQRAGGKYSGYQWLTGTILPSLRQRLLPIETDIVGITARIDFYRRNIPWINRGLSLWAGLAAAEFSIVAPSKKEQTDWMRDLKRSLRMYSVIREFFWQMKAFGQSVILWKTDNKADAKKPISIECASLQIYQPRYSPINGAIPRISVMPGNDASLRHLIELARGSDEQGRQLAEKLLLKYPKVLVESLRGDKAGTHVEVSADELEREGYHFEYAAYDRRHYEDWGFPGMYSIIPYLEMLMLGDDADINALHHYKAGILLVRIGPDKLVPGVENLMPSDKELTAVNTKLSSLAKARLPAWAARGDLRIDWVVPPEHIISAQKTEVAAQRVFDWLGIPKLAWPGQEGHKGSFGTAHIMLKFVEQEIRDARQIASELFERWFYERSIATNAFKDAVWPKVRFNESALVEPRVVMELMKTFLTYGGADMQTIAEMMGYDAEVWLSRRADIDRLKKEYNTTFDPEFIPPAKAGFGPGQGKGGGRPSTGRPSTPEAGGQAQPRPSTAGGEAFLDAAGRVVERLFGMTSDELREAVEEEIVTIEEAAPEVPAAETKPEPPVAPDAG